MNLREVASIIESISASSSLGPAPKFDVYHVIKSLILLLREGSIGRVKLSRLLSIGEGTTRTMLSRMKDNGLIEESRRGCSLTDLGCRVAEAIVSRIPHVAEVSVEEFGVDGKGVAVLVRGFKGDVNVVRLRDEAIRVGAKALITLMLIDERLSMPTVEDDVKSRWPHTAEAIMSTFKPLSGDVILISIADDVKKAERGALIAAWSLAFKWN